MQKLSSEGGACHSNMMIRSRAIPVVAGGEHTSDSRRSGRGEEEKVTINYINYGQKFAGK